MEQDEIIRLAKYYARRFGYGEFQDDVAQDVLVRYLESGKEQPIKFAVIDWLRKNGRHGKGGRSKDPLQHTSDAALGELGQIPDEKGEMLRNIGAFDKYLSKLMSEENRAVGVLFFVWDFTVGEIAHVFGVPESTIYHRLSEFKLWCKMEKR